MKYFQCIYNEIFSPKHSFEEILQCMPLNEHLKVLHLTPWPRTQLQYSSQVTSRVHALQGMRTCEKLARAQGALEEL